MKAQTLLVLGALLLVACGGQPVHEENASSEEDVPELNLNLPSGGCQCAEQQDNFTFLERGLLSLEQRDYLEALQHFQNYQRIEKTDLANLEAGIAIAYLSILPDSPIFDRDAARDSYSDLRKSITQETVLNRDVELMHDSLESFLDLYGQIDRLKKTNADLRAELQKREEAIKRLRDLTLGRESEPAGLLGN